MSGQDDVVTTDCMDVLNKQGVSFIHVEGMAVLTNTLVEVLQRRHSSTVKSQVALRNIV